MKHLDHLDHVDQLDQLEHLYYLYYYLYIIFRTFKITQNKYKVAYRIHYHLLLTKKKKFKL